MSRNEPRERQTAGNEPAMAGPAWVLENVGWVRALSLRLAGAPDLAEDVAQETWVRLIQNPPPSGVAPGAWITGIAKKVAVELRRQQRSSREREKRVAQERVRADSDARADAQRMEHQLDVERDVVRHVRALPEPLRHTLLLHYFEMRSVEDVASMEGISPSTVRTRLSRGMAELRIRLRADKGSVAGAFFAVYLPKGGAALTAGGSTKLVTTPSLNASSLFALMSLTQVSLIMTAGVALCLATFFSLRGPEGNSALARHAAEALEPDTAPDELASIETPVEVERRVALAEVAEVAPAELTPAAADSPQGIHVAVLDDKGALVAGIPVALVEFNHRSPKKLLASAVSSASGHVWLDVEGLTRPADDRTKWAVFVDAPGHEASDVELDPMLLPESPVELVLAGEVGTLSITAADLQGRALPHAVTFTLGTPSAYHLFEQTIEPGGAAVFNGILLHESLRVKSKTTLGLTGAWTYSPELTRAGELAEIEVRFGPAGPAIFGVLKTPDGTAIPHHHQLTTTMGVGDREHRGYLEIGPDGQMQATFKGVFTSGEPCWFEVSGAAGRDATGLIGVQFSAVIPSPDEPLDLGLIQLEPIDRSIPGRVVHVDGKPLPPMFGSLERRDQVASGTWRSQGKMLIVDEKGRFTVRVPIDPGSDFCIKLHSGDRDRLLFSDRLMLNSTMTEAVIVVQDAVTLEGRVVVPDGWDLGSHDDGLIVHWDFPGKPDSGDWDRSSKVQPDGRYKLRDVPVGKINLVLRRSYRSGEFLRWESVSLSGEGSSVELDDWDIGGDVQRLRFELRRPEGVDEGGWVTVTGIMSLVSDGVIEAWVPKADHPIQVGCHGCRTFEGRTESIGDVVTLEPAIQLTVEVALPREPHLLAAGAWWFRLQRDEPGLLDSLVRVSRSTGMPPMGIAKLSEEGRAALPFPETGEFYISFYHGEGPSRQQVRSEALPPALRGLRVTIEDGPAEQTLVIGSK